MTDKITNIKISDITLRECENEYAPKLSFKEKQEIAKLLEKLNADVIETGYITDKPADTVFIRMLASTLENSILSVPVKAAKESIDMTWDALSKAKKPRMNLIVPTSTIGIEYDLHKKPDEVPTLVGEMITYAKSLCDDIEFTADDAVRSDSAVLSKAISTAISSGAATVTLCDSTGDLLPDEAASFVKSIYDAVPELKNVTTAFHFKDKIGLASAAALCSINAGITMVKVSSCETSDTISLKNILGILKERSETVGIQCSLNTVSYARICERLSKMTGIAGTPTRAAVSAIEDNTDNKASNIQLGNLDIIGLRSYIQNIGYDISEEDVDRIFTQYKDIARSKDVVSDDIEALIAETAGQAPPVYQLRSFVINSGSAIVSTAHIEFEKDGEIKTALSSGDGPIDAAFKAAEMIFGRRYELEDFQIHAVTSGREATGDALIKIRCDGKLYSGRGVSTDIVKASIRAYLSAVNKILAEG